MLPQLILFELEHVFELFVVHTQLLVLGLQLLLLLLHGLVGAPLVLVEFTQLGHPLLDVVDQALFLIHHSRYRFLGGA